MRAASVQKQSAATAARKRRRSRQALAVLLGGVLALGLIAFAVVQAFSGKEGPVSSVAPATAPAISQKAAVSPPASTPVAPVIPAATGPLDVSGMPPLYNRFHTIPEADRTALALAPIGSSGQQMETKAATAFLAMQQAAAEDGITLSPVSGYRTLERQTNNYNSSIQNYLASGYSQSEAVRLTEQYYAIPGTSEHEMGLAMDIGQVDDAFAGTPAYTWLQEHCTEFGFIYRYPKEYVDITCINWEPWHYRFVGVNHAAEYTRLGMHTLEEYITYLQGGTSASTATGTPPAS